MHIDSTYWTIKEVEGFHQGGYTKLEQFRQSKTPIKMPMKHSFLSSFLQLLHDIAHEHYEGIDLDAYKQFRVYGQSPLIPKKPPVPERNHLSASVPDVAVAVTTPLGETGGDGRNRPGDNSEADGRQALPLYIPSSADDQSLALKVIGPPQQSQSVVSDESKLPLSSHGRLRQAFQSVKIVSVWGEPDDPRWESDMVEDTHVRLDYPLLEPGKFTSLTRSHAGIKRTLEPSSSAPKTSKKSKKSKKSKEPRPTESSEE